MKKILFDIYKNIEFNKRINFFILLILMIISSFSEVLSLGTLIPFLTVLVTPDLILENVYIINFFSLLNIDLDENILLPITLIFISAAIFAGSMRLVVLWFLTKMGYSIGSDLSCKVYNLTLYQPYLNHVKMNSSELINVMISKVTSVINSIIIPFLTLISSAIMIVATMTFLIFINPLLTFIIFSVFIFLYLIVIFITRNILLVNGKRIALEKNKVVKLLQEGLGGIRDILLHGNQKLYVDLYKKSDFPLRMATGINLFIGNSPRFIIESLGIIFLALLAFYSTKSSDGIVNSIPLIGTLAMAAQRLLPVLQQSYLSWSSMLGGKDSAKDVIEFLNQSMPDYNINENQINKILFNDKIEGKNLFFKYDDNKDWVIENLSFSIKKGEKIGIVGKTGGGKSTLIDIIMFLIKPNKGSLYIDGNNITSLNFRSWQNYIAHVPQNIFLSDTTIMENIAFGVPYDKIDFNLVKDSANKAQIGKIIETWPKKFNTIVGERGIRLSGGQRQRIGIARALYKKSDVIIFDEATNALDDATEKEVIESINNLDKNLTIIMIAHRLSTLKGCNKIIKL